MNVEADNVALVENAGGVALGDLDSAITGILAGVNESTTDAAAVNDVMKALVNGLVDLVNLFNPDRILLGGLFSELLNQYRDELVKAVVQRSYSGRDSAPEFATHSLDRACVLGAAEAAWEPFLSSPRTVRN